MLRLFRIKGMNSHSSACLRLGFSLACMELGTCHGKLNMTQCKKLLPPDFELSA